MNITKERIKEIEKMIDDLWIENQLDDSDYGWNNALEAVEEILEELLYDI